MVFCTCIWRFWECEYSFYAKESHYYIFHDLRYFLMWFLSFFQPFLWFLTYLLTRLLRPGFLQPQIPSTASIMSIHLPLCLPIRLFSDNFYGLCHNKNRKIISVFLPKRPFRTNWLCVKEITLSVAYCIVLTAYYILYILILSILHYFYWLDS